MGVLIDTMQKSKNDIVYSNDEIKKQVESINKKIQQHADILSADYKRMLKSELKQNIYKFYLNLNLEDITKKQLEEIKIKTLSVKTKYKIINEITTKTIERDYLDEIYTATSNKVYNEFYNEFKLAQQQKAIKNRDYAQQVYEDNKIMMEYLRKKQSKPSFWDVSALITNIIHALFK